jgi:hypothetical protein
MTTQSHEDRSGELLGPYDVSDEQWREYEWEDAGQRHTYRINNPQRLFFRERGTTHRIVDKDKVVHCVPAPGVRGCVLRWYSPNGQEVAW